MTTLSGWGRFPSFESARIVPRTLAEAQRSTALEDGIIPRGNGRAYGDAAIGAVRTLDLTGLNRICAFDISRGLLTVEAGVLLADIIATFGPRGFFPAVVPGTRFVTVGGAIAADVHGKNHHRDGGFGDHVERFVLATPSGEALDVSRTHNSNLFAATVGGMGLTGAILQATLRLRRIETGWIKQRIVAAPHLDAALSALDAADDANYSVAWIDGLARGAQLGRSLVFVGEHANMSDLTAAEEKRPFPALTKPRFVMPVDLPPIVLNRYSVGAFNEAYFRLGARKAGQPQLIPVSPYFFPLDGVGSWNRIYGRHGFVQHQCVLPLSRAKDTLGEMLNRVAARGDASFLAVLKKLGASCGLMSFPMPGYTLALDFAMRPGLLEFLDDLDKLVMNAGGRIYLAKDARQSRATFEAGYPNVENFRDIRRTVNPSGSIRSRLSERLGL